MNDAAAAFALLDVRAGTITSAQPLAQARKPAYRLTVDFGSEFGTRTSSAQLTDLYEPSALVGKQVLAAVNLPPKRIAGFVSEVLVLGVPDENGAVVLIAPEAHVANGVRMF